MEDYAKDLFEQPQVEIFDNEFNVDTEEVEFIDMDEIDDTSLKDSKILVDAFTVLSKDILSTQPKLQQRILQYKDTIRMHLKILKSSECVYDILINNITKSPTNASLYTGLTRLQSSMADARTQIVNTMNAMDACMSAVELELNFESTTNNETPIESTPMRGSRDFINSIKEN